eukprot:1250994-Alexandrium_andersonii.AAC.1
MSASLVGSEMCIRDSSMPTGTTTGRWRVARAADQSTWHRTGAGQGPRKIPAGAWFAARTP